MLEVAVLIPCYNEEVAIAQVVADFHKVLPSATIYVYDNNSTDMTAGRAAAAGAEVRTERRQGKGFVVRRMFGDIDADVYVLVDGDATYDATSAPVMIDRLLGEHLDMVVGKRLHQDDAAYRAGHQIGNRMLTGFLGLIFGRQFSDILSGYRVFSKRFVKSFPALSHGFEIETELSAHALDLGMAVTEVPTAYFARPAGSVSKLRTYQDGWRILLTMVKLFRAERPLDFFSIAGAALVLFSLAIAVPLVTTFIDTGLVPRLPTAVLATGTMILAFLSFAVGLILDTVTRGRQEAKRLAYLAWKSPSARGAEAVPGARRFGLAGS